MTATHTYAGSSEVFPNPERGFYHYTETHYADAGSGYTPLDVTQLTRWRTQDGVTLVYRIFYLEKFTSQDTIDDAYLGLVAADLAAARSARVKLVVRFAYSEDSSADAPPARVVAQIRQLAPVLNASADVVAVLQAGFVGRWGEWYYTDNFASDPAQPWSLSAADWAARGGVLAALLDATDQTIPVQVRYPGIKQRLVPAGDPRAPRVGIHDDCFLASPDDYGTFANDSDRGWLADQTKTVAMGGETCGVDAPRSQWPAAAADLTAYHWSFLNADYNSDVLSSWGTDGLTEARRRLGYRLRLTQGTFPTDVQVGGTMSLQISLTNDGYAAPMRARPVQLVMRSAAATYRMPLALDVRSVQPGQTVQLPLQVSAPATPGTYALYLALPDPSPSLAGQPAYSVRLANAGTWDSVNGWNDLQDSVQVHSAPTPSPSPGGGTTATGSWLSSLTRTTATNGWGPAEKDTSNGEAAAGDGHTQTLRGRQFSRGLGVHSFSSLTYPLGGRYGSFQAAAGIDDETQGRGSVVFQVYVDGVLRYTSQVLTGRSPTVPVSVPVAGGQTLRLVVTDAGDGNAYDHADWAGARLD